MPTSKLGLLMAPFLIRLIVGCVTTTPSSLSSSTILCSL